MVLVFIVSPHRVKKKPPVLPAVRWGLGFSCSDLSTAGGREKVKAKEKAEPVHELEYSTDQRQGFRQFRPQ